MKVGMNLLLWTPEATEEHLPLIKNIKDWGFDGVELPMFSIEGSPWKKLGAAMDDLGLGRTVVAVLPEGANMIGEAEAERTGAVDYLKRCVDATAELGAEAVAGPLCSPVGLLVGRGPSAQEIDWAVEGLRAVGEHARGAGVAIALEGINRFETYIVNCQADLATIVDRVGVEGVGQMYDTFHANIEEKSVTEAIKTGGARINHVHISANDRATPGEDQIRWDETFAGLKAIGYNGWLTIEAFGQALPELAGATCIWRKMMPSEEHVAREGCRFIRENW